MRDPQQALAVFLPQNFYPGIVDPPVKIWDDGMITLSYNISKDKVALKHIFTGNMGSLQRSASSLLEELQIHVPLRRRFDNKSMFSCIHLTSDLPSFQILTSPSPLPHVARVALMLCTGRTCQSVYVQRVISCAHPVAIMGQVMLISITCNSWDGSRLARGRCCCCCILPLGNLT